MKDILFWGSYIFMALAMIHTLLSILSDWVHIFTGDKKDGD